MPGGRKTHDYPQGKPVPVVLVSIAMAFVTVLWVIFASGGWIRAVAIIALFVALGFTDWKLHRAYERTGQAVPVPRTMTVVKFFGGMPAPLFALRAAFFLLAAALVVFGIAPLTDATAKRGMIGSVLSLVVIGCLNVAVERYYVRTGRGKEIPVGSPGSAEASQSANQH